MNIGVRRQIVCKWRVAGAASMLEGHAIVERGRNPLGWLAASLVGFPRPGPAPVRVEFIHTSAGEELWRRNFGGRVFTSRPQEGRGRWAGLIVESCGPVCVGLAPIVSDAGLDLVVRRWSVCGVPLPLRWSPRGPAFERVDAGRFTFDVTVPHPWLGLLVRYRGHLNPVPAA